ncbi:MAG: tetratricopeptide repeat protein [Pseudomonadota bacterium]
MADRDDAPKRDDNDALLREVSDDLNEERLLGWLRERAPILLGGAGAILIAVAGFQFQNGLKTRAEREAGEAYSAALASFEADGEAEGRSPGRAALEAQAETGREGYAHLAALRLAAAAVDRGDIDEARTRFAAVAADAPTRRMRNFARLRLAYLSLDENPSAAALVVSELEGDPGAFLPFVREVQAFVALKTGRTNEAQLQFEGIAADLSAPQSMRARAEEYAAFARSSQAIAEQSSRFEASDLTGALGLGGAGVLENAAAEAEAAADIDDVAPEDEPPAEDPAESAASPSAPAEDDQDAAEDGEGVQ